MKLISVFAIWRDGSLYVDRTLKQLEEFEAAGEYRFQYFFYENDSIDNTASVLSNWINRDGRVGVFKSEVLNAPKYGRSIKPERMAFLCLCRNKCKLLSGENKSDFSLIFDSDIIFSYDNLKRHLYTLSSSPNAVMVAANSRQNIPDLVHNISPDSYYDTYAFKDKYGNVGPYFSDCPSYLPEDRSAWALGHPIRVNSAFGGFAILPSTVFNSISWSAEFNCDHVNFCYEAGRFGDIYVDPLSKVYIELLESDIDMPNYVRMGNQARDIINQVNNLRSSCYPQHVV